MALSNEDLQAISALLKDQLQPINDRLERLEIKTKVISSDLEDLSFKMATLTHEFRKESAKLDDEMETVIAVLEARELLSKKKA